MLLSRTKNEPAHYSLKIESFSILSDDEDNTSVIESDVFEAAGHKWRLDLYPNGNEEEKGQNHISLYLMICDTESLPKGWEVYVDVKFFVYDHIAHNYVLFQDVDGNRSRFHENQIGWGFDKLISLEHFKESSLGYLFNDSCVFGAEVFQVPKYTLKDRCLSMIRPPPTSNTYSLTVYEFSAVTENCLESEVFKVGKLKWSLLLYPKGCNSGEGTNLSIFLKLHEAELFPKGWRVYAKYELRVKNQGSYDDDRFKEMEFWFCDSAADWGFSCFMLLTELKDTENDFLLNDRLMVEAKISVVSMLKDFL